MTLAIALLIGLGAGVALLWWRKAGIAQEPINVLYYRCEDCGQKIRYAHERAGRPAGCPRCKRRCILPMNPEPLAMTGHRLRVGEVRQRQVG